ncbi:hypothetical protein [Kutzneria sp. 744]|uniref:hypothetical protein n=1 Tax=Kutzneria sp. (strain 744) TaxID=345341 RepID=UPI001E58477D|nr:hypothetical protein [Kutzneria sp. 744]
MRLSRTAAFVGRGEPARYRRSGQMHHGIHAGQQVGIGIRGSPPPFARRPRGAPDQADHLVAAGAEQGRELRADQAAAAGDRDRHRIRAELTRPPMSGQVVGQLPVPVGDHRSQQGLGHRGVDPVGDPRRRVALGGELMAVPPGQDRAQRLRDQLVHEPAWRVVPVRLVRGDPSQPARQPEHRTAITQRRRFREHAQRRPRRRQPRHRSTPAVPGEHLVRRKIDDAGMHDAHGERRYRRSARST